MKTYSYKDLTGGAAYLVGPFSQRAEEAGQAFSRILRLGGVKPLTGLYPIAGAAGSGKTTFLLRGPRSMLSVFNDAKLDPVVILCGEPEYATGVNISDVIGAFAEMSSDVKEHIVLLDSLRDLTLSTFNIDKALGIKDTGDKWAQAISASSATASGGISLSYLNALAFLHQSAVMCKTTLFAVINPLFVENPQFYSAVDAVTNGCIRPNRQGVSGLLRVWTEDGPSRVELSHSSSSSLGELLAAYGRATDESEVEVIDE